jgi:hypothetical protein
MKRKSVTLETFCNQNVTRLKPTAARVSKQKLQSYTFFIKFIYFPLCYFSNGKKGGSSSNTKRIEKIRKKM